MMVTPSSALLRDSQLDAMFNISNSGMYQLLIYALIHPPEKLKLEIG